MRGASKLDLETSSRPPMYGPTLAPSSELGAANSRAAVHALQAESAARYSRMAWLADGRSRKLAS